MRITQIIIIIIKKNFRFANNYNETSYDFDQMKENVISQLRNNRSAYVSTKHQNVAIYLNIYNMDMCHYQIFQQSTKWIPFCRNEFAPLIKNEDINKLLVAKGVDRDNKDYSNKVYLKIGAPIWDVDAQEKLHRLYFDIGKTIADGSLVNLFGNADKNATAADYSIREPELEYRYTLKGLKVNKKDIDTAFEREDMFETVQLLNDLGIHFQNYKFKRFYSKTHKKYTSLIFLESSVPLQEGKVSLCGENILLERNTRPRFANKSKNDKKNTKNDNSNNDNNNDNKEPVSDNDDDEEEQNARAKAYQELNAKNNPYENQRQRRHAQRFDTPSTTRTIPENSSAGKNVPATNVT